MFAIIWFTCGFIGAVMAVYYMKQLGGNNKWILLTIGVLYTITGAYGLISALIIVAMINLLQRRVDKR